MLTRRELIHLGLITGSLACAAPWASIARAAGDGERIMSGAGRPDHDAAGLSGPCCAARLQPLDGGASMLRAIDQYILSQ